MTVQIRVGVADRERLGCPEWIDIDYSVATVGDVEQLANWCKFDPFDWPGVLNGQIPFEQAGDPEAKPRKPPWVLTVALWLALNHTEGVSASWAAVRAVNFAEVFMRRVGDEVEEGKDEAPSSTSDGSGDPSSTGTSPDSPTST